MDTVSTLGPPCPICGESTYASQPAAGPLVEIGDARFLPRMCAECGNLQLVLTRVEELESTSIND
jgi:hypothetical protein